MRNSTLKFLQPWFARHRWREDYKIILDFNRSLTLITDPDSLMASIAVRIKELFRVERVIILRALSDPGVLTVVFSTESSSEGLENINLIHDGRLAKWLLINESALIVDKDLSVFNYLSESEQEMLSQHNVRVCTPLLALNRLTGVILMCSVDRDWDLSDYNLKLLQMLMGSTSIALENAFLYQQQRDRLRRLYRAERLAAAGQLAASVAHEIRNPLTSIRSTVQYLLGEFGENNPKRNLVKGLIAEVDRIDRTVDGLLSLTRSIDLKPETIDIGQLVGETLLLVKAQGDEQNVEIEWSEPDSHIHILGDVAQLKQLFLNLILNALQAMPDGGSLKIDLSVEYRLSELNVEKGWARISLTDSGCGIPAEILDRVVDPFFTTKKGGTGLGLFTSYAIAQQHGGELEINSSEGEGTTVTVRFPIMK